MSDLLINTPVLQFNMHLAQNLDLNRKQVKGIFEKFQKFKFATSSLL